MLLVRALFVRRAVEVDLAVESARGEAAKSDGSVPDGFLAARVEDDGASLDRVVGADVLFVGCDAALELALAGEPRDRCVTREKSLTRQPRNGLVRRQIDEETGADATRAAYPEAIHADAAGGQVDDLETCVCAAVTDDVRVHQQSGRQALGRRTGHYGRGSTEHQEQDNGGNSGRKSLHGDSSTTFSGRTRNGE